MRTLGVLFGLVLAMLPICGQTSKDAYGKPLIVLTEQNPWLMAIGSDTPSFVLYENGKVIYKHVEDRTLTIYESPLDSDQLRNFIGSLNLADSFYELPTKIIASNWTDQPNNVLTMNLTIPKTFIIYGNIRRSDKLIDETVPKELLLVIKKLINFSGPSATVWKPQVMEVMFWDFGYAKEMKAWPKDLPDLKSVGTKKFANGMYSVYLNVDQFEAFKKFSTTIDERTAVLINGKKMTMSARYPFPNIQ
ncbi:MAG: hypothetical protein KA746_17120 [Pyrinomonadaceae bacterium]|nr:hypothetical protein [Pyrinomonadaceae bacterium]